MRDGRPGTHCSRMREYSRMTRHKKFVGMFVNSVPFSLHIRPSGYKNRLRVSSTNVRCRYRVVSNRALNLSV